MRLLIVICYFFGYFLGYLDYKERKHKQLGDFLQVILKPNFLRHSITQKERETLIIFSLTMSIRFNYKLPSFHLLLRQL